jgi:phospho-N-acetylmuramoyl-pentapeptide-transferase
VLYYLHLLAAKGWPVFEAFKAVTFRAAFAALFAFLLSVVFGAPLIAWLRARKMREDVSKKDARAVLEGRGGKRDVPTMGGVLIIGTTLLAVALFARPEVIFVPLAFFVLLALGLVGFYDDWLKIADPTRDGLKGKEKILYQFFIGGGAGVILALYNDPRYATSLVIPFVDAACWPALGYAYAAWAAVVIVGTSNAVNLTDGLDGLATLCALTVTVALGLLAYFSGHAGMAEHLAIPRIRGAEELTVICAALAGACAGFLWFNASPAEIFMGDTGSLAIGGLVGLAALAIKQELMLLLVGGIFVVEALSVIIQVASFKLRKGKRVFLMTPLHHHFEKLGWPGTRIVARFFIISVLLAVFSVALLRVR